MILLFRSTGYIGSEFVKQLTNKNIKFISHNFPTKHSSTPFLDHKYSRTSIDYVINAAGYTGKPNVDACEMNKYNTIYGNVVIPQMLANFCNTRNIPFGHVSSGCIYLGRCDGKSPFTEEDVPNFAFKDNNCSFYSGTKQLAEDVIRNTCFNHYIWRLRVPFDEIDGPRNYISKVLNYKRLLDVENSISNKSEFVNACIESIVRQIPYGIYNVTNTGSVTTKYVVDKLKKTIAKDKQFEFFDSEEEFYKIVTKTPRSSCVLSNEKLLKTGIKMKDVDESLDYCLDNWMNI